MKQTLIKIIDDHYVVVDDSEIKKGDWVVGCTRTVVQCMYPENVHQRDVKKITHSTQPLEYVSGYGEKSIDVPLYTIEGFDKIQMIPLSEVKELIGEVDVEKNMWYERNVQNPYSSDSLLHTGFNKGFELGYNQALEDNKEKKYTEEDLLLFSAELIGKFKLGIIKEVEDVNTIIQSLQPKTQWQVTFDEQGKLKLV